jgi:lysophospholipase L1-like esterase
MTAANTAHIITKADLGNLTSLSAGDTVLVTVSGNDAYHKSTTLANTITTVRSITNGSALDNINALDTVIQFNTLLIENKANVTTDFKIHAIKKLASSTCRTSQLAKKINVYSFALKPEEHQPSGTCNFSRIDNAKLITTGSGNALTIYAVNYNVLRVMSGMGGLAYSN